MNILTRGLLCRFVLSISFVLDEPTTMPTSSLNALLSSLIFALFKVDLISASTALSGTPCRSYLQSVVLGHPYFFVCASYFLPLNALEA